MSIGGDIGVPRSGDGGGRRGGKGRATRRTTELPQRYITAIAWSKSFKAAVPNVPNQEQYIADLRQGAAKGELGGMFLFEAFDEPWKTRDNGVEPHWGLWDKDGRKK